MKQREEKNIPSLGIDMQLAQMNKFVEDFDNARSKENKKTIKRLIFILGPLFIGLIGGLAFNLSTLILIGGGIALSGVIVTQVVDYLKEVKKIDSSYRPLDNQPFKPKEDEKDVSKVLEEGIGNHRDSEFYTDRYRQAVEAYKPPVKAAPSLKIARKEAPLNKEETMEQIVREMDAYCIAYKLPPINIKNGDWDCFFDTLYGTFATKGMESKFYDTMSYVGRQAISRVLLEKSKTIGINDFIKSLNSLKFIGFLNDKEIEALKKELFANANVGKVVNLSDYVEQEAPKR